METTKFQVFVDDNFHYMDASHRSTAGTFGSAEEAIGCAKQIVDGFLTTAHVPGMTKEELVGQYQAFGEDPFIVSDGEKCDFSAWAYADMRCGELCGTPRLQDDD